MFIFNKKQHFEKVLTQSFNSSMTSVNELCELLMRYGAKIYIDADVDQFVVTTHLFNTYFVSRALRSKYFPKYTDDCSWVISLMTVEICNRLEMDFESISKAYLKISNVLTDISRDKNINLFYASAISYLQLVFNGKYVPDELGYEIGTVEDEIAKVFQKHYARVQYFQP